MFKKNKHLFRCPAPPPPWVSLAPPHPHQAPRPEAAGGGGGAAEARLVGLERGLASLCPRLTADTHRG